MSSDRDELIQELNEALVRSFQLEKTVKWWSECTVNWREKWAQVRSQRNQFRDDLVITRGQYKALVLEYSKLKEENNTLKSELDRLRPGKQVARVEPYDGSKQGTTKQDNYQATEFVTDKNEKFYSLDETLVSLPESNTSQENIITVDLHSPSRINSSSSTLNSLKAATLNLFSGETMENDDSDKQELDVSDIKISSKKEFDSMLDSLIIILKETGCETCNTSKQTLLSKTQSKLDCLKSFVHEKASEIENAKSQNEEIVIKYEKLKEWCHDNKDKGCLLSSPPAYRRYSSVEVKINELHSEIRRLQQENCDEWNKREKCESDMSNLRRKFNSLNETVVELQEEISKKREEMTTAQSTSLQLLREELDEKDKLLIETKSLLNKTRKQVQEKCNAIDHEKKRTEHYDEEMKKLRLRIDQLKEKLLTVEEEVDARGNQSRRLQRSLDEQIQVNEALQVQLKHLTDRVNRYRKTRSDDES